MNKEKIGEISEKIAEILGLETDKYGNSNMFLIKNEDGKVLNGINFTNEVIEITQFIDDNFNEIEDILK